MTMWLPWGSLQPWFSGRRRNPVLLFQGQPWPEADWRCRRGRGTGVGRLVGQRVPATRPRASSQESLWRRGDRLRGDLLGSHGGSVGRLGLESGARLWGGALSTAGAALKGGGDRPPLFQREDEAGAAEAAMTKGRPLWDMAVPACWRQQGRMGGEWVMSILRLHGESSSGCLMPW